MAVVPIVGHVGHGSVGGVDADVGVGSDMMDVVDSVSTLAHGSQPLASSSLQQQQQQQQQQGGSAAAAPGPPGHGDRGGAAPAVGQPTFPGFPKPPGGSMGVMA